MKEKFQEFLKIKKEEFEYNYKLDNIFGLNNYRIFYFLANKKKYYFVIYEEKEIFYLFENNFYDTYLNGKNIESLFIKYKNKIIMSLKNYDEKTNIKLFECSSLKEIKISEPSINISFDNFLNPSKNGLLITRNEKRLLENYNINIDGYKSYDDLMYYLNNLDEEFDDEELDYLITLLNERMYYEKFNK